VRAALDAFHLREERVSPSPRLRRQSGSFENSVQRHCEALDVAPSMGEQRRAVKRAEAPSVAFGPPDASNLCRLCQAYLGPRVAGDVQAVCAHEDRTDVRRRKGHRRTCVHNDARKIVQNDNATDKAALA
jgi:hypothetical protein